MSKLSIAAILWACQLKARAAFAESPISNREDTLPAAQLCIKPPLLICTFFSSPTPNPLRPAQMEDPCSSGSAGHCSSVGGRKRGCGDDGGSPAASPSSRLRSPRRTSGKTAGAGKREGRPSGREGRKAPMAAKEVGRIFQAAPQAQVFREGGRAGEDLSGLSHPGAHRGDDEDGVC